MLIAVFLCFMARLHPSADSPPPAMKSLFSFGRPPLVYTVRVRFFVRRWRPSPPLSYPPFVLPSPATRLQQLSSLHTRGWRHDRHVIFHLASACVSSHCPPSAFLGCRYGASLLVAPSSSSLSHPQEHRPDPKADGGPAAARGHQRVDLCAEGHSDQGPAHRHRGERLRDPRPQEKGEMRRTPTPTPDQESWGCRAFRLALRTCLSSETLAAARCFATSCMSLLARSTLASAPTRGEKNENT